MKTEVFYCYELAQKKVEELRDCGVPYTYDIEYDYNVDCTCYVISWELY